MNVLLLEPDRRLAKTYRDYLAAHGYTVRHCYGAQAAILAADTRKPDVVLVEPQLIDHSGIEFLYEFRSYDDWRFVPVIIVSGIPEQAFDSSRQLLDRLGVQAYYYKPTLTLDRLLQAVRAAAPLRVAV